jgi:hypothetical protein
VAAIVPNKILNSSKMKNSQTVLFVVLGIVFWFNAAMLIRYFGASVFTEGRSYHRGFHVHYRLNCEITRP